ncbi:carboxylate--amine ligase [Cellulomonas sp. NPDC055163]
MNDTAPEPVDAVTASTGPLQPVILGADIGVYALARSFHEAYGVRSIVVSGAALGPVADSRIVDNVLVADGHDPRQLVDTLVEVARGLTGRRLVLMANSDWLVRVVVQHRDELEPYYVVPFLSADLLDQISDKATFAEICERIGISVPRTVVQDFARAGEPGWQPVPVPAGITYPLIAKAASSADYQDVEFEGKKKVFEISEPAELDRLWVSLAGAGFRGRFVVQELIPGDDTQMRSITAYVDSRGQITLLCSAHVLLEEHTPSGLGNPAAMITTRIDPMLEQARRFLTETGYVGFANFDVKVDPRDGSYRFFEVNPRIGRNNYYVTAAGANPMRFLVEDRVEGRAVEPVVVEKEILYAIVPHRLLLRYVADPALAAKVKGLIKAGAVAHPLRYAQDSGPKRVAYVTLALVNQVRKFRTHYPELTGTGF